MSEEASTEVKYLTTNKSTIKKTFNGHDITYTVY